jgi:predicted dienelactone hydrolase
MKKTYQRAPLLPLGAAAALLLAGSLLLNTSARAAVGLDQIPGQEGDGPVTVFYPTASAAQPLVRGPFTLNVAWQGTPARGNGRLVVISHGSGGAPWVHSDLARTLVEDGFVVALPEHQGDNHKDHSKPGPDSWKRRPAEASRAIDAVTHDPRFAALLSFDRVGLYGMSAGGHTALSFAGGRWSRALFKQHCEAHIAEDFPACFGLIMQLRDNYLDGLKKNVALFVIRHYFDDATWQTHSDARVQAIVAGVPAAADFEPASLAAPRVPLGLVTVGQDKWLAPRFHSDVVLKHCVSCERIADLPAAGHGALLSPPPPALPEAAAALLNDPPGFDRSVLPEVDRKITAFFRKHLLR